MNSIGLGVVALVLVIAAATVAAHQVKDDGARLERLAGGVYAIIHEDATRDWPSGATNRPYGNTGVIVGDDGVLVVDATDLPSRAQAGACVSCSKRSRHGSTRCSARGEPPSRCRRSQPRGPPSGIRWGR